MNEENNSEHSNTEREISHTHEEESEAPQISKEDLASKIDQFFEDSELHNLELYYEKKVDDIDQIMFTLYEYTKEVESLKLQMPIIKPPEASKFIKKRDDDLFGGSSTMSRRSNSSTTSRSFGNKSFGKPMGGGFGAQKASINISGLEENSKFNNSIMRRTTKSNDPKLSALKQDLAGTAKVSKSHETVFSAEKKPSVSNIKPTTNASKPNGPTKGGIIEAAKSGVKGVKKLTSGVVLSTNESMDKEAASKARLSTAPSISQTTNSNNATAVKLGSTIKAPLKAPIKKSDILNKVKSNSSSLATAETETPKNFKFEPKKKTPSGITGGSKFIESKNFYLI